MARERAFQRYLIRVCRPWRCWDRPVWPNRGELCADSLKLIPVVCSSRFLAISPLGGWSSSCLVKALFVGTLTLPREWDCRKKRAEVDLRPAGWKDQSRSQTLWGLLLALAASYCFCSQLLPLSCSPLFRLASSFANLRVTVFCERARQCGMAKVMAKPSACIHLRWVTG